MHTPIQTQRGVDHLSTYYGYPDLGVTVLVLKSHLRRRVVVL